MGSNALLKTLEQLLHKIKAKRRREIGISVCGDFQEAFVGGPQLVATDSEVLFSFLCMATLTDSSVTGRGG